MGGGGAADAGRVPNRHPSTPTCAVTNATMQELPTQVVGVVLVKVRNISSESSGVVIVITPAFATLNSGVYNIKEQYAEFRSKFKVDIIWHILQN